MANRGCGCKSPTNQRMNENGYLEQSFDGGLTWERVTDDPRFNAPIFPPLVGVPIGEISCAGAKSGREVMRLAIEQFATNTSAWESIFQLITVVVTFLGSLLGVVGGAIVAVLMSFLWVIFQVGQTAFAANDWEAALDTYKCILFCNIEDDASFTESGWQQVKADIVDQLDGLSETFLWNMVNSLGTAGLTNSARALPGLAGDCSECGCGACVEPTTSGAQAGENLIPRPDLGAGWYQITTKEVAPGGDDNFYAEVQFGCCELDQYIVQAPGINAAPGNRVAVGCGGTPLHTGDYGVNNCVELVLFRSFGVATFLFKIVDCP